MAGNGGKSPPESEGDIFAGNSPMSLPMSPGESLKDSPPNGSGVNLQRSWGDCVPGAGVDSDRDRLTFRWLVTCTESIRCRSFYNDVGFAGDEDGMMQARTHQPDPARGVLCYGFGRRRNLRLTAGRGEVSCAGLPCNCMS